MSGGHYQNFSVKDPEDLVDNPNLDEEIVCMHYRLSELGYADAAAADTLEFLQRLRAARRRMQSLQDNNLIPQFYALQKVWQAVEWWDSLDGNENQVREALANYPQERTTKAEEALVYVSLPANVVAALLDHLTASGNQPTVMNELITEGTTRLEVALADQGWQWHPEEKHLVVRSQG